MPIYTYRCKVCKHKTERMCSMSERDKKVFCSNGHEMTRNVDRPGLVWAPTAGGMRT